MRPPAFTYPGPMLMTALACLSAGWHRASAAPPVSRRIDLAEFATAVRYEGDSPDRIRATALERGVDGWEVYALPDGTRAIGLEWNNPRDLAEVNIEFRHAIAHRERIRVQYWSATGKPAEASPEVEDAFHGRWVTARAEWWAGDRDVSFAFLRGEPDAPSAATDEPLVIRTRRLRFLCGPDDLPPVRYLRAYGSGDPVEATFAVRFGSDAPGRSSLDVTVVNGVLPGRESSALLKTARITGHPAELTVRFSPDEHGFSRTVVTLRDAADHGVGFSFLPAEVRRRGAITVPALDAVVSATDPGGVAASRPDAVPANRQAGSGEDLRHDGTDQSQPPTSESALAVPPAAPISGPLRFLTVPDPFLMRLATVWPQRVTARPGHRPDTLTRCWTAWSLDLFGFHEQARNLIEGLTAGPEKAVPLGRFIDDEGFLPRNARTGTGATALEHAMLLWLMAQHHAFTADRAWTGRQADSLVAACDWLVRQRRAKTARPLAWDLDDWCRGLLPPGALVTGGSWHERVAADAWALKAMCAAADALADLGHPQTGRIAAAAADYRTDLLAACREAQIRTPVVRMPDGTFARGMPARYRALRLDDDAVLGGLAAAIQLADCGIESDRPADWYEARLGADPPPAPAAMWSALALAGRGKQAPATRLLLDAVRSTAAEAAGGGQATEATSPTAQAEKLPSAIDEAALLIWTRRALLEERSATIHLLESIPPEWLRPGGRVALEAGATRYGPVGLQIDCTGDGATIRWKRTAAGPAARPAPARIRVHLEAFGRLTGLEMDGRAWSSNRPLPASVDLNPTSDEGLVVLRR